MAVIRILLYIDSLLKAKGIINIQREKQMYSINYTEESYPEMLKEKKAETLLSFHSSFNTFAPNFDLIDRMSN